MLTSDKIHKLTLSILAATLITSLLLAVMAFTIPTPARAAELKPIRVGGDLITPDEFYCYWSDPHGIYYCYWCCNCCDCWIVCCLNAPPYC